MAIAGVRGGGDIRRRHGGRGGVRVQRHGVHVIAGQCMRRAVMRGAALRCAERAARLQRQMQEKQPRERPEGPASERHKVRGSTVSGDLGLNSRRASRRVVRRLLAPCPPSPDNRSNRTCTAAYGFSAWCVAPSRHHRNPGTRRRCYRQPRMSAAVPDTRREDHLDRGRDAPGGVVRLSCSPSRLHI